MSLAQNNHKNYVASLQQEGRERKARRAEEIADGMPLNRQELAELRDKQIAELEEKLGIDGSNDREPQILGTSGTTAYSAFQGPTIRNIYGK